MKSARIQLGTRLLTWVAVVLCTLCLSARADDTNKPAGLKVSGYGFFGDLRLKRMLRILQTGKKRPEFLNASYVEDAALLLMSRMRDDGYLQPTVKVKLTLDDGRVLKRTWDQSIPEPLPRPLRVREAKFKIKRGVFYYFNQLGFTGLAAMPEKKVRSYFIETAGLFSLKRNRLYSPDKFDRSLRNLQDELQRMGYQQVAVAAENLERDDHTGAVNVTVRVSEGPRYLVRSVRLEVSIENTNAPTSLRTNFPGVPYSQWWEQDYALSIKTNFYHLGYPDTSVQWKTLTRDETTNEVQLDLQATVQTGPFVRVGDIIFQGNKHTKESVLTRRVPLHEGDLLDRTKAEHGRYRMSRLGVFDSVALNYTNRDGHTRDVIYQLDEGKRIDVSLLFGYGSYEMLRGGVQLDQYNVFGRAHHQQLKLIQSFKSSSADYLYTMPEFFGENMDVFIDGSWLRREEISFNRLEYGGGAGVRKFFRNSNTDISARYNYQILEANGVKTNFLNEGSQNSGVGAIIVDVNHDRRDNPLYPHRGYRFFSNLEIASEYLASDVNYQRLDMSFSYHLPLNDSEWMHFGLSHGFVATVGSVSSDLPFNRRFFPGGENSVRGYQQGEAAPRDENGKIVGAETYLQGNIEFEQALTPKWSLVAFVDGVGFARRFENYPADEELFSAGGGIQWKTLIGPLRLEYGYNLNPRPKDPTGTLQFSLGFPF